MKLSAEKRQKLYNAIHDPIVDLRIKLKLLPMIDAQLAQVTKTIWDRQKRVLELDRPN